MVTNIEVDEVDIVELTEKGMPIPAARRYRTRIDGQPFIVDTRHPTVEQLLALVDKRLCAFELIELLPCENLEVEPGDKIDLHERGLRGFITAHREIVRIFFGTTSFKIKRGQHTIDQILALVGENSAGYTLYEEKPGHPPMPVPEGSAVEIKGCEVFASQVKSGKSS